jgi:hypothetical protein
MKINHLATLISASAKELPNWLHEAHVVAEDECQHFL